jgi:hypothetical protein
MELVICTVLCASLLEAELVFTAVTFLSHVQYILGSNLVRVSAILIGFTPRLSKSTQANSGIIPQNRPLATPSTFALAPCSQSAFLFYMIWCITSAVDIYRFNRPSSSGCCLLYAGFLLILLFSPEDVDMFLRNVRWLSMDYAALYPGIYNLRVKLADFGFTQRWPRGVTCSGIWRRVVWQKFTGVEEDRTDSIFTVEK